MAGAITDLIWRGTETVQTACAALVRHGAVEVQLPPDFHHAVFSSLRPASTPGEIEELVMSGGAELLARISRIPGLGALARLEQPVTAAGARVRVVSPSPKILITVQDEPR